VLDQHFLKHGDRWLREEIVAKVVVEFESAVNNHLEKLRLLRNICLLIATSSIYNIGTNMI
jgi:hypothetical protein